MSDAVIDEIAAGSHCTLVEAGSELVHEGADVETIHILVSGSLVGVVTLPSGRMLETVQLSPGESVGWAALVCGEKAIMTVTAVVDSLVVEIEGESLKPVLQSNSALKQRLAELVIDRMQRARTARVAASGGSTKVRTTEEILRRIESFLTRSA